MNTLGYAMLGLVALEPRTGYEIAQRMKAPIGYMWTAQHSQVYTELARLTRSGYLTATVVAGRGPHEVKRYTITSSGRQALDSWVDAPLVESPRNELLLRMRSLWLISPDRALHFLAAQRHLHVDRLSVYRDQELSFAPDLDDLDDPTSPAFGEYSTLRYGISRMEMTIAWLDWLAERISSHRARRTLDGASGGSLG
jgi:DNA-binding PadR family transcriptional regulator